MIKRRVLQDPSFAKNVGTLIAKRKLKLEDFEAFKRKIAENPEMGDLVQGTGGVRKARLKSASKGTSGGFRVCYYFRDVDLGEIFLLVIYQKNEKEELKAIVEIIKRK